MNIMGIATLKGATRSIKRELFVYQEVLRDDRTPTIAKLCLGLAIGYLCLPFDLIPDFIPILGHLDDVIIIPLLVYIALRLTPAHLIEQHRAIYAKGNLHREQGHRPRQAHPLNSVASGTPSAGLQGSVNATQSVSRENDNVQ